MSTAQGHTRTNKLSHTGQFREAGLHEWMPFVISRARSHERSQLPLPGWFLSRPWFMLCVTWNLNLQPWSSTNATAVAFARLTGERWWRKCKKKKCLHRFLDDQKIVSLWKKCIFLHSVASATSSCLLSDTLTTGLQNAFKDGCKLCEFTVPAFHCKVRTGRKNSQGNEQLHQPDRHYCREFWALCDRRACQSWTPSDRLLRQPACPPLSEHLWAIQPGSMNWIFMKWSLSLSI